MPGGPKKFSSVHKYGKKRKKQSKNKRAASRKQNVEPTVDEIEDIESDGDVLNEIKDHDQWNISHKIEEASTSATTRKFGFKIGLSADDIGEFPGLKEKQPRHYRIVDFEILQSFFSMTYILCEICSAHTQAEIHEIKSVAMVPFWELKCKVCKHSVKNSPMSAKLGESKGAADSFDLTRRTVLAMKTIGSGQQALESICTVLNLPQAPCSSTFTNHAKKIATDISVILRKESGEIPEEKAAFSDDEIPEGVDLSDSYFKSEFKDTKKVKKKKGKKEELTEEEIQQKKQEEAKLALLMMDEEDQRKHFTLEKLLKDGKKKNKKNKKQTKDDEQDEKTDNFQVNVGDERFSALFDSHLFNVDPSAPEFKKTKGTEAFINEKQQRRRKEGYSRSIKRKASDPVDSLTDELKPKQEESILSLVKSVKSKTQKFQDKRKKVS